MSAETEIGPLTWVKGEIDLALGRAGEALHAASKSPQSVEQLKLAQAHLHQAHGALAMIGLEGVSQVTEAGERLLAALVKGEQAYSAEPAEILQRALDAVRRYLDELVDGIPDQPLRLLPIYRELLAARGIKEVAPSDLFFPDLSQAPPQREPTPLAAGEEIELRLKRARLSFQHGMLKWLKNDATGLAEMQDAVAAIEATQSSPFWWIALALLDALAAGLVPMDMSVKRFCAAIDQQMHKLLGGQAKVAERLLRDALYLVALSPGGTDRLEAVRATYRLSLPAPETERIRGEPSLREMRDTLSLAMDEWNRYSAGSAIALPQFHERATQLVGHAHKLAQVDLSRLVAALAAVANMLRKQPLSHHNDTVALEVATALLLAENAINGFEYLGVEFARQVDIMTGRLAALLRGETLAALAVPQLDEISRRAQERILMSQVAREILANLDQIEQVLDAFFREPSQATELAALDKPMRQVEGALAMLGETRAATLLAECARKVAEFAQASYPPSRDQFEELAKKLSALGFFIEALQHGPADIDAILNPALPPLQETIEEMSEFGMEAGTPEEAALIPEAPAPQESQPGPSPETVRLAGASGEAFDAELLAIFVEEALEVMATIAAQLQRSLAEPHAQEPLAIIRRAFHTLKGSGRMVGLSELGEAAWAVEKVTSRFLQLDQHATAELHDLFRQAHTLFSAWIADLEAGGSPTRDAKELVARCERMMGEAEEAPVATLPPPDEGGAIVIGELTLTRELYHMYLGEARAHLAVLERGSAGLNLGPPTAAMNRAAHTLGGISATLGIAPVNVLAHALERALMRISNAGQAPDEGGRALLAQAIGALQGMMEAIAGRHWPDSSSALAARLDRLAQPLATPAPEPLPTSDAEAERRKLRLMNELDLQLLPVFLEEGQDLLGEIGSELRAWRAAPENGSASQQLQRLLHTLKGSARMTGAMSMGELLHSLETSIQQSAATPALFDELDAAFDRAQSMLEGLRRSGSVDPAEAALIENAVAVETAETFRGNKHALLRVRADLIDELVNEAGEMAVSRSRIEGEMRTLKTSLQDLTESVMRMRNQLREIEIQAESQMQSQLAHAQEIQAEFDPLEMDRYTRLQELTRMMAESVNDVTTVQHTLLKNVEHANTAIVAQARLNRELSQALMAARMVPFNSIADRLYRIVRQTAKELDKRANLDIRGGQTELDRSVLEKIVGPIEHLLRNAIAHGLEEREQRIAKGKREIGQITLTLAQEGNEIAIDLSDDGVGLDFAGIRAKARTLGLLGEAESPDEQQLTELIFLPGFTTARNITELSGRGVGLDVVKNETAALGGRIEVSSQAGHGTRFCITLPLTLAIAQAVLVQAAGHVYAIPSAMVEQVQEVKPDAMEKVRAGSEVDWQGNRYPWHYLPRLLGDACRHPAPSRRYWLLLLKSGTERICLEADNLVGKHEVVVKNIGPQLSRVVGITGATVLGDGEVALIINPFALAGRLAAAVAAPVVAAIPAAEAPIIMVVDDSLTVRKITSRLLTREGYQVLTAKDGIDALELMQDFAPAALLLDIEMPRMGGFELTKVVRGDERLRNIPIIMITSRSAEKHRNFAREIGVNHYLGKPYDEEELLQLLAGLISPGKSAGA